MQVLLLSFCLIWQPTSPTEYFIESVDVENRKAVAAELIIAQAGLSTNGMIDEDALRQAIRRIEQLPFVLSARFSLKKGSERGRYRLLIHIEETNKFFGDIAINRTYTDNNNSTTDRIRVGYRHFFGKASMVYATWAPDSFSDDVNIEDSYIAGYSNFNALGKGILFNAELFFTPSYTQPVFSLIDITQVGKRDDTYALTVSTKIPLSRSRWLNMGYNRTDTGSSLEQRSGSSDFESKEEFDGWSAQIGWEDNTTDDAFLPTKGRRYSVTLFRSQSDGSIRSNRQLSLTETTLDTLNTGVDLDARWYLNNRPNHSWPLRAQLFLNDGESEHSEFGIQTSERWSLSLGGGYQYKLPFWHKGKAGGDFYTGANLYSSFGEVKNRSRESGGLNSTSESETYSVNLFLAYRGKWGVASFNINYTEFDGSLIVDR